MRRELGAATSAPSAEGASGTLPTTIPAFSSASSASASVLPVKLGITKRGALSVAETTSEILDEAGSIDPGAGFCATTVPDGAPEICIIAQESVSKPWRLML